VEDYSTGPQGAGDESLDGKSQTSAGSCYFLWTQQARCAEKRFSRAAICFKKIRNLTKQNQAKNQKRKRESSSDSIARQIFTPFSI